MILPYVLLWGCEIEVQSTDAFEGMRSAGGDVVGSWKAGIGVLDVFEDAGEPTVRV